MMEPIVRPYLKLLNYLRKIHLSLEETAEVLKVSIGTVRRDWSLARAWLHRAVTSN